MENSLFTALSRAASLSEDAKLLVDGLVRDDKTSQLQETIDELYDIIYGMNNPYVDFAAVEEGLAPQLARFDKNPTELYVCFGEPYFKMLQNRNMRVAVAQALISYASKKNIKEYSLWSTILIKGGAL